jgi:hypothetical protein
VPHCLSGLFSTLAGACSTLSKLLGGLPGTLPQLPGCGELLSCALLELWRCCARIFPGPIITAAGMQVTVMPAVQLSVAVMRKWPGPGPIAVPDGSSSSSSSSGGAKRRGSATRAVPAAHLDGPALLRQACSEAQCLADKLALCLFCEVREGGGQQCATCITICFKCNTWRSYWCVHAMLGFQ